MPDETAWHLEQACRIMRVLCDMMNVLGKEDLNCVVEARKFITEHETHTPFKVAGNLT